MIVTEVNCHYLVILVDKRVVATGLEQAVVCEGCLFHDHLGSSKLASCLLVYISILTYKSFKQILDIYVSV